MRSRRPCATSPSPSSATERRDPTRSGAGEPSVGQGMPSGGIGRPMRVDELVAIEEIRSLKARYFRHMDTKDWEAFADEFTADAIMDTSGEAGGGVIEGRREIVSFVRNAIREVTTVHHGHMPEINIVSPTEATGIWAMEDMLRWP